MHKMTFKVFHLFLFFLPFSAVAQSENIGILWQRELSLIERIQSLPQNTPEDELNPLLFQLHDIRMQRDSLWVSAQQKTQAKSTPLLSNEGLLLTTEPFRGVEDLKTGDLLITRGEDGITGDLIAQQDRVPHAYSHIAMFYRNHRGQPFTIESNQFGLTLIRLDGKKGVAWTHRNDQRVMIVRPRDAELGQIAAQTLVKLAMKYNTSIAAPEDFKDNLPFNMQQSDTHMDVFQSMEEILAKRFEVDGSGHKIVRMKCNEAVRLAYRLAFQKKFNVPDFKIPRVSGKTRWLQYLKDENTFLEHLPLDNFAIDPAFRIVAAWSSPQMSFDDLLRDALSRKLLDLAEKYRYSNDITKTAKILAAVLQTVGKPFANLSPTLLAVQQADRDFLSLLVQHTLSVTKHFNKMKSECRGLCLQESQDPALLYQRIQKQVDLEFRSLENWLPMRPRSCFKQLN